MAFFIVRNDITKMETDAVVNTANPKPVFGAGTDFAVYKAAGEKRLLAAREKIGEMEPGQSAITEGFDLPAKYIIHTVGISWQGGDKGEEDIIRRCYKSAFNLALEKDLESLAMPLLASGSYGFPKEKALKIALSETELFLSQHDMEIYLVVFDDRSYLLSSKLYGDIDEYINNNYVEEKKKEEYSDDFGPETGRFAGAPMMAAQSIAPDSSKRKLKSGFKKMLAFGSRAAEKAEEDRFYGAAMKECPREGALPECNEAPIYDAGRSLDDVVNNLDKSFMELVFSFADQKGITDVQLQKKANLDRKAFSKLKCGTTKNPSKSTALALAVGLELGLDDTKDLLSRAGFALSPCSRQDLIVSYFIERQAYDIYEINLALFEHGEQLLGSAAK